MYSFRVKKNNHFFIVNRILFISYQCINIVSSGDNNGILFYLSIYLSIEICPPSKAVYALYLYTKKVSMFQQISAQLYNQWIYVS